MIRISKTSKVWLTAVGGGLLTAAGGVLLVTGVGAGAGAVVITSGLATIGSVLGGGMLAGIGVLGAGTATAAAISAAIAHAVIKDPQLKDLAEKLQKANELYNAAKRVTESQKHELDDLNDQIGEVLRSKKKDREQLEELKTRIYILSQELLREAA